VTRALLLSLFLAACAGLPVVDALESRPWPMTAHLAALTDAVNEADGYVLGTVERAKEDRTYDDICGVIMTILGRCSGTHAYRLTIRSAENFPPRLWVFVPAGDTLPLTVGTEAVFLWKMRWIKQLWVCAERMRRGVGSHCESDYLPVMTSLDDVVAPQDSALVAVLFAARGAR